MARQKSDSFSRNVAVYDADFNQSKKLVEGQLVYAKNLAEAKDLFGNDDAKILNALNTVLRETQIKAAIATVTGGIEEKHIMSFIKPYRVMPEFAGLETAAQTASILAKVKETAFVLAALKAHCAAKAAEGDDEAEDE